jgi:hypothetical protein
MNTRIKLPPLRELVIYVLLILTGLIILIAVVRYLSLRNKN